MTSDPTQYLVLTAQWTSEVQVLSLSKTLPLADIRTYLNVVDVVHLW
jgi:hypothetical protein